MERCMPCVDEHSTVHRRPMCMQRDLPRVPNDTGRPWTKTMRFFRSSHRRMECRSHTVRDARDTLFPSHPNAWSTFRLTMPCCQRPVAKAGTSPWVPIAPQFHTRCTCIHALLAMLVGMGKQARSTPLIVSLFRSDLLAAIPPRHGFLSPSPRARDARKRRDPSRMEGVAIDHGATRKRSRFGPGRSRALRRQRRWCAKQHWWRRRRMETSSK